MDYKTNKELELKIRQDTARETFKQSLSIIRKFFKCSREDALKIFTAKSMATFSSEFIFDLGHRALVLMDREIMYNSRVDEIRSEKQADMIKTILVLAEEHPDLKCIDTVIDIIMDWRKCSHDDAVKYAMKEQPGLTYYLLHLPENRKFGFAVSDEDTEETRI